VSLRILLASDAPDAPSGYGVQIGMIARMLRDLGHAVAICATFGHQGAKREWDGFPVYPGALDGFGNDAVAPAYQDWQADILITLKDLWVYRPQEWGAVRWCPLVPVDHDPMPPALVQMLRAAPAYATIAYAPYGQDELTRAGFAPLYAPHSYDSRTLFPVDRAAARKAIGIPEDVFAVGMVAVNRGGIPSRKAWAENLQGFAKFASEVPSAHLYAHTYTGEHGHEGALNLPVICDQLGITDRVHFIDQARYKQGLPIEYLRHFYSAIDVLNAVSLGEGFGVPTLEAQACGTPVIVGDWCSSPDLCFAGAKIPKEDALPFYDGQSSHCYIPHPKAIAGALLAMYHEDRAKMRPTVIAGAARYEIARVREDWRSVTAALEERVRSPHSLGVVRIVPPASVLLGVSAESDAWAAEVTA
jgi:glycosyltransferase involved in cell wall biosynthesis